MLDWLQGLGRSGLSSLERLGRGHLFLVRLLMAHGPLFLKPALIIKQIHSVGVLTLLIVLVSGLFVGMVLALQLYNTLVSFNAEESLGVVLALTLIRELGPVVTGLLFAGLSRFSTDGRNRTDEGYGAVVRSRNDGG